MFAAGPVLFVFAMTRPVPTVEEQLARLGHAPAVEAAADAPVEYAVDLPFDLRDPEPAPVERPAAAPSKPAPALAVAVAEASVALAVADEGAGTGAGPWEGPAGPVKAARPAKGKRRSCDKAHPHVRVGDDGVVEIDRSLVEEYTADLSSFMELGYSRPYDEEGVHGWFISGFSCASPVAKAGFQRGDVLLSVNGRKTRTWVGVYVLYQKLKHKDAFEVALVRKGEPLTLRFRVVPG